MECICEALEGELGRGPEGGSQVSTPQAMMDEEWTDGVEWGVRRAKIMNYKRKEKPKCDK